MHGGRVYTYVETPTGHESVARCTVRQWHVVAETDRDARHWFSESGGEGRIGPSFCAGLGGVLLLGLDVGVVCHVFVVLCFVLLLRFVIFIVRRLLL